MIQKEGRASLCTDLNPVGIQTMVAGLAAFLAPLPHVALNELEQKLAQTHLRNVGC